MGAYEYVGLVNITEFNSHLCKVYPNPLSDVVYFSIHLTEPANVILQIYNNTGSLIKTVNEDYTFPGVKQLKTDLTGFTDGIYYYRLNTSIDVFEGKISLIK
jgi:hypothetical protein